MAMNIYCDIKTNTTPSVTLRDGRTLGMVEVTIAYRERFLEGLARISHHPTVEARDKKAVIRVSCLVIRENHGRGPGSLQEEIPDVQ